MHVSSEDATEKSLIYDRRLLTKNFQLSKNDPRFRAAISAPGALDVLFNVYLVLTMLVQCTF